MELYQLKALVEDVKDNERILKEKEEAKKKEEFDRLMVEADSYLPKVKNWIDCLSYLETQGMRFTSPLKSRYTNLPNECILCTDGVYHTFGLYGKGTPHRLIGIEEGGACGDDDIVTDGNTWYIMRYGKNPHAMTINAYKSLLYRYKGEKNRIEKFEDRFNALMDMLMNKAKKTV